MTATRQANWDMPDAFWKWALLAIVPIILAGVMKQAAPGLALPDEHSYRTPLSDALIESSEWRTPAKPEADWRQPRSSSLGWRTETPSQPQPSRSKRTIHLFPRHQPGNPFDYDHIDREEKPLITIFEFDSY